MAYVKNVAAAVFLAATSHDAQGKAFHVLDTERTSIQEFYEMLLKIYLPLKKSKVIHLPFWMGRLIGAVISFASKATNVRRPLADPTHYAVYSISKNLDFDNRFFLELMRRSEEKVWSKEEGIEELINHAKIEKQMSLN
jgi:nucleoside-diphosphate-sugar epimerase